VHYGDAMGPLRFALGLEHVLDALAPFAHDIRWMTWYLDDGTLLARSEAVPDIAQTMASSGAAIGL